MWVQGDGVVWSKKPQQKSAPYQRTPCSFGFHVIGRS